jgi:hypothetical protein
MTDPHGRSTFGPYSLTLIRDGVQELAGMKARNRLTYLVARDGARPRPSYVKVAVRSPPGELTYRSPPDIEMPPEVDHPENE